MSKKKHDEAPEPPSLFDNLDDLFPTQKKETPTTPETEPEPPLEEEEELPGLEAPPVAESVEGIPVQPVATGDHPGGSGPLRDVIDENFLQFASYANSSGVPKKIESLLMRRILVA